ncbi:unnamed protein product [Closterium sp. NIES-53]
MHTRLLVSGLPRSLPPLSPSPAPPCLPCVEGRQRAAPHSSSFPPTTAPLQTLHMDVWGPARVSGQGRERYFLLVVDDYTRFTTVFPLHSKGQVVDVLIPWIRVVRLHQPLGSLRGSRMSGMGLVLGGRGPVVLTGHADASWVDDSATQRSSLGYTFSLGSGSVSWRSTRSSSVLSSSCEAEIYTGAMAAQELRWLTYLLTDLGEQPRSPRSPICDTSLLKSCTSVASFVLRTWPLGPTLLIYSPRHFCLVIMSASLLC